VFIYLILILFSCCLVAKKVEEKGYFLAKHVLDSDWLRVSVPFLFKLSHLIDCF
jgi:hypothetical protein